MTWSESRPTDPPAWDEVVTCILCGTTTRARYQRSGYRDGTWLCLNRRACSKRQRKRDYAAMWAAFRAGGTLRPANRGRPEQHVPRCPTR